MADPFATAATFSVSGAIAARVGGAWLWICSAIGLIVAGALAIKRGLDPLHWIILLAITYLAGQSIMQAFAVYRVF